MNFGKCQNVSKIYLIGFHRDESLWVIFNHFDKRYREVIQLNLTEWLLPTKG